MRRKLRPVILDQLKAGARLALISDAGMPLISDPGYKLVRECIEEGLAVHVVPGPSAPLMALVLSGLPTDRFTFAGFLPNRSGARRTMLAGLAGHGASLIFFETAPRVAAALADIADVLGDPPVALARELTKFHEEVLRGTASEVAAAIAERGGVKGEITLVVAPPEPAGMVDEREHRRGACRSARRDVARQGGVAAGAALRGAAARPLPARPGAERRRRCRRALSAGRRFAAGIWRRRRPHGCCAARAIASWAGGCARRWARST
jgi:16S rRNA (cytidine1402-2'-O)-methyltransferase